MKGTVLKAIEQLVTKVAGAERWRVILERSTYPEHMPILATADVPDEQVYSVIGEVGAELDLGSEEVFAAFGDYWMSDYGPRIYASYYRADNARDFLLGLDDLHDTVTKRMPGAKPPRFRYEWESDDVLLMDYLSERGLIDLMIAMVRAVGKHFDEPVDVEKVSETRLRVRFPS